MARRKNISRQTLILLEALYREPDIWWYGYNLSKTTGLKSGTIYPMLIRLKEQGYLEAEWRESENPGRPPRHVYRLTFPGKQLLAERHDKASTQVKGITA